MKKIKITQVKSSIGYRRRAKATLAALGLKKMNAIVEHEITPQILGMVNKIKHLVTIVE